MGHRVHLEQPIHEEALALLRENAGSQYDAKCVHALERVVQHAPASARRAVTAG